MAHAVSPYGDGLASERIVVAIRRFAGLPVDAEPPALDFERDLALEAAL